ncbi:MAG: mechanosensitive ion channel [Planctomycetes bacterium]|nr:mechanosensitive ion channel [Planctomycetota bacterium]
MSEASVLAQIAEVEANPELAPEERATLLAPYREALAQLQLARQWGEKAAEWERLIAEAPTRLEALRTELAQPRVSPKPEVGADTTLPQVEQQLREAEAQLEQARKFLEELKSEPLRRADRRGTLSSELASLRQLSEQHAELLGAELPADAKPAAVAARTLALAQRRALSEQIRAHELELRSYDSRNELLLVRREKAQRTLAGAEELVSQLQALLAERRKLETERASAEARRLLREAARQSPAMHDLALENEALAKRRGQVSDRLEQVTAEVSDARQRLERLRERYASVRRKVETVGLADAMGMLLRREYEELPKAETYTRTSRLRKEEIARVQFEQILLQERYDSFGTLEAEIKELVATAGASAQERAEFEAIGAELVSSRRQVLQTLIGDQSSLAGQLVDQETLSRELAATTQLYREYIEERILWVRSVEGNAIPALKDFWAALRWLTRPSDGATVLSEAASHNGQHPLRLLSLLLGLAALTALGVYARRRLEALATQARSKREVTIAPTLKALGFTLALTALGPASLWGAADLLLALPSRQTLPLAWAAGFRRAAVALALLELLRHLARPHGVGAGHFRWPSEGARALHRALIWLILSYVPATFVIAVLDHQPEQAYGDSLGRALFVLAMLALAVFATRHLRPGGAVVSRFLERNRTGFVSRLRHVWFGAAIGVPLVLIGLAALGYYYTAVRLGERLELSLGLVLGAVVLNGLVIRWLQLARKRITLEEMLRSQARERSDVDPAMTPSPDIELRLEEEVDLRSLSAQSQKLFRTLMALGIVFGLLGTWANVLPALKRLRTVRIYPRLEVVELSQPEDVALAQAPLPDSVEPGAPPSEVLLQEPETVITLADLGLAALALLLTFVAGRNVPALLEMILLDRLPLDSGARYAVSALTRYGITIVGAIVVFSMIGIGWSKVQWLVAALTFGLGFGLQEIFANFVSGLILFIERPIRIGDTVTVGAITGVVSRIKIRATTVTDYTNKELVIPNREFVTGQVVNWSLTNSSLKLILPVGVAYGSNTRLARATLIEVAKAHPRVLQEPAPRALFLGFGDSSLSLELHATIRQPDERWLVRDELHEAIDDAFRKAGVEIAFPQRDLHLRSAPSLEAALRANAAPPAAPAAEAQGASPADHGDLGSDA